MFNTCERDNVFGENLDTDYFVCRSNKSFLGQASQARQTQAARVGSVYRIYRWEEIPSMFQCGSMLRCYLISYLWSSTCSMLTEMLTVNLYKLEMRPCRCLCAHQTPCNIWKIWARWAEWVYSQQRVKRNRWLQFKFVRAKQDTNKPNQLNAIMPCYALKIGYPAPA